ncbi:HNH endonuclease signature motif containing protein [Allopusillimonas ginsengisoli]|uniref:HNH endonuclease signature motif containing protein n=1 Tax=Allopusillimonas ginsengisoli TaxID=453575 RepID=UPI0039C07C3C
MALSQDDLKRELIYTPETGIFKRRGAAVGPRVESAGTYHTLGYIQIRVCGGRYLAHRLAWLYEYGRWPEFHIDHINGIRDDNRISNLRDVSAKQNRQNTTIASKKNVLGILGVSKRGSRYVSRIVINGKKIQVGSFKSQDEAQLAYLKAKKKYHPNSFITRNING